MQKNQASLRIRAAGGGNTPYRYFFCAGRRVIIPRRVGGVERSEVSMFSFRAGRRGSRAGACGRLPVPSGAVRGVRGVAGAC